MKTIKLLSTFALVAILFTSCYTEVVIEDDIVVDTTPVITLNDVLTDYEIWYVDINRSSGPVVIPFLQKAFTVSFRNGNIYANNNLSGIGSNGGGFGIDVGYYDTVNFELDAFHDLDGSYSFDVRQLSGNEIELYEPSTGSRYVLEGYQRSTFDYDLVFYENIHYFLQEFEAWEKIYTSEEGNVNLFDNENFLQFLPAGQSGNFRSSEDTNGTAIDNIFWDYDGIYDVDNVSGNLYQKTLTLDYNFPDNEFFELIVIDDETIELYQVSSGTTYQFRGKGYLEFRNSEEDKNKSTPKYRSKTEDIKKDIQALKTKKLQKLAAL